MPEKKPIQTEHLPVDEQHVYPRLYEMSIRFTADMILPELNEMLKNCGCDDTPILPKANVFRIQQTVPFIPDEDTLKKIRQSDGRQQKRHCKVRQRKVRRLRLHLRRQDKARRKRNGGNNR